MVGCALSLYTSLNEHLHPSLIQPTASQIVRNNDIRDGVKHKLNVIRVRGARHVAIDLLRRGFVLRLELCLDVRGRLSVLLSAYNE